MNKRYYLFLLTIIFINSKTLTLAEAGETFRLINLAEADIVINIKFDDIFYYGSERGNVDVLFEVVNLYAYGVTITGINTLLCTGISPSCESQRVTFSNPTWTEGNVFHFRSPGIESWQFRPSQQINLSSGSAWIQVTIQYRTYMTTNSYQIREFKTEPKDTNVQILGNGEDYISGFEFGIVLLALLGLGRLYQRIRKK